MQSQTARIGITQPLCATCATPLAPGIDACPICGRIINAQGRSTSAPQQAVEEPLPLPLTQPCPSCGHPLLPGARGCPACGRAKAIIPRTSMPVAGDILEQRYRVVRPLNGGMSTLLLAEDQHQSKKVVLKLALDAVQERALRREDKILSEILHSSMPRTLGKFFLRGNSVLILEYIDGYDLEQRLTRVDRATGTLIPGQPYPLNTVLNWGAQLCQLLDLIEQYSSGAIIHHDIKPTNIICTGSENSLVLIDWGAARHSFSAPLEPGRPGVDSSGTYGTVGYAPPEQYRGQSTLRSDVYGLAATLYHLATNDDPSEHPFEFPRLTELGAFGWLLGQALARNPADRPSAAQLGTKLMALLRLQGETLHAPDGTPLHSPQALADWCCTHWDATRSWLGRGLPEALQLWWPGHMHDAELLHTISQRRPISDQDIDQALSLIDQRYREAEPILSLKTAEIHFGAARGKAPIQRRAEIRNTGRRLLLFDVQAKPAPWLHVDQSQLRVPPGTSTQLQMTAYPDRLWGWKEQHLSVPLKGQSEELGALHCMIKPGLNIRRFIASAEGLALILVLFVSTSLLRVFWAAPRPPVVPYPTATALPVPSQTATPDMPRFYSSVPFADWRAMLYVAHKQGQDQLPADLQSQAYDEGQRFMYMNNISMAIEAFRAAGSYKDARTLYYNLMDGSRPPALSYPPPASSSGLFIKASPPPLSEYPLEQYRRHVLLKYSSISKPVATKMRWVQQAQDWDYQHLGFNQSAVWLLLSDTNTPGATAWSIDSGKQLMQRDNVLPGNNDEDALLIQSNNQIVVAFASDGMVQINNIENGDMLKVWNGNASSIKLLDVSADLRYLAAILETENERYLARLEIDTGSVQKISTIIPDGHIAISRDGQAIAGLTSNGDAHIWAGQKYMQLQSGGDPITDFALTPDSFVFRREDGAVRRFSLPSQSLEWVTELPESGSGPLSFTELRGIIAAAGKEHIWILEDRYGMLVDHIQTQGQPIMQQSFSTNGLYFAAQDAHNNVMLWSLMP